MCNSSEIVRDRFQNALLCRLEFPGQTPGALVRLVDDDAPVDDQEDAARCGDWLIGIQP